MQIVTQPSKRRPTFILNFGIYTAEAIDANGCSIKKNTAIASPPDDLDIDIISNS
jgi:hypothetical protein